MYRSFRVKNFRCFKDLHITDLDRINLIAGRNNVGKTALLEALFLHCGAYKPALILNFEAFRGFERVRIEEGQWKDSPWTTIFHRFDSSESVELVSENSAAGRRSLRLKRLSQPADIEKIAFVRYSSDESQGVASSSEIAEMIQLEYEEDEKHGSYYMVVDSRGVHVQPSPPPPFPAFFQSARIRIPFTEEAERFGELEKYGKQNVLLKVLQLIEPRLTRLATVVVSGEPILHGDIGMGRLIPLPVMGDGMARLATLVLHIGNAPKGIVLVDEIENGLHHSILTKMWRAIGEVAREFDTQVFATTHSLECIVAAHRAFTDSGVYDFRLHRLERTNNAVRAVTYNQEVLEAAIETELEVR